jgi:hypothetical protein
MLDPSSVHAAARSIIGRAGLLILWACVTLGAGGCRHAAAVLDEGEGESGDSGSSEEESGSDEAAPAEAPALLDKPEIIFHPNQPMIIDVIVELDRPGEVELTHDDDPGVRVTSLSVEDEGRRHHLRVRGLAPDTEHATTLTLLDIDEPDISASEPLSFTTNYQLPGFRPNFEVELADPERHDPSYRLFDYAYSPLWDPAALFVVDAVGVTRWYYEAGPGELGGSTSIWAGVELLDDGNLLAVRDGAVTVVDELGEQRLRVSALDHGLSPFHHEAHLMGNGNFLTLGNSFEDIDYSSLGPDHGMTHVAGDLLVELDPSGEIVWTWDAFDHLDPLRLRSVPGEGLPYLDFETGELGFDWTHGNGMQHTAEDDVILLSMRHQDWILAIDHESGEVLWRLGPEGDFELLEGTWFYHQHSPQWQPDGTLLLYDNALGNPDVPLLESESRAVRYALDFDAMTATQVWDSREGPRYLSAVAGDADRTPSGNVLVLDSARQPDEANFDLGKNYARLVEVGYEGAADPIWTLTTKLGSFVYRATAVDRLPGEAG